MFNLVYNLSKAGITLLSPTTLIKNIYHVYPYNCLVTYIKHMNSAIEGVTTLLTCITIPHLIGKDIVTVIEEEEKPL